LSSAVNLPKRALSLAAAVSVLISATGACAETIPDILPAPPSADQVERERLAQFQFEPIEKVAKEGRTLRRVSFADIYKNQAAPAVTVEKKAGGEIELTVVSYNGRVVDHALLKPEAWTLITAKDSAGLAARRAGKASDELCLGSTAVIEAAEGGKARRREAEVCRGQADLAALEYARFIAEIAITSIPRCAEHYEATRESSWTLRDCLRWSFLPYEQRNFSGGGNEAFTSYATKTWNNLTDDLVKEIAVEISKER